MLTINKAIKVLGNPIFPDATSYYNPSRISQRFGFMPDNSPATVDFYTNVLHLIGHNGIDIPAYDGTPVYASHAGTIVEYSPSVSTGIGLKILSDPIQWLGRTIQVKSIYWHLKSVLITSGRVSKGQQIALSNNTGYSTGPHLHFGLDIKVAGKSLFGDNGYGGFVDPLPFMENYDPNFGLEFIRGTIDITQDMFKLIKTNTREEQYVIVNGKRLWVLNPRVLEDLKETLEPLKVVPEQELLSYPDAGVIGGK